jgi:hypothetical protein
LDNCVLLFLQNRQKNGITDERRLSRESLRREVYQRVWRLGDIATIE